MSYVCASCGKSHEEPSRHLVWPVPKLGVLGRIRLTFDNDQTCRIGESRYFIQCELQIPFLSGCEEPLGFISWVEVRRATYDDYIDYRIEEDSRPALNHLVTGLLANPIPGIENSLGVMVKFEVAAKDPVPYIKWVEPDSTVASRLIQGATHEFWQAAISARQQL